MQDVLLDEQYEAMVEVVPVDTLDEVMEFALIKHAERQAWSNGWVLSSTV